MNLLPMVIAAGVTTASMILLLPILRRWSMDQPNARSSHDFPVPRGGGLAVATGTLAALTTGLHGSGQARTLIGILVVVTAIGWVDDLRSSSPIIRLVTTAGCSAAVAVAVAAPFDDNLQIGILAAGCCAITGFTNSFNFMDGINGISALTALISGIWYASYSLSLHSEIGLALSLAIIGSAAAFLPWNFPSARVFLGDSGSYLMGFSLATTAFVLWSGGLALAVCVAPLALYVVDTATTMFKRISRGANPLQAHREHVYQRLADSGLSHVAVSGIVSMTILATCAIVAIADRSPSALTIFAATLPLTGYLLMPHLLSSWPRIRRQPQ